MFSQEVKVCLQKRHKNAVDPEEIPSSCVYTHLHLRIGKLNGNVQLLFKEEINPTGKFLLLTELEKFNKGHLMEIDFWRKL